MYIHKPLVKKDATHVYIGIKVPKHIADGLQRKFIGKRKQYSLQRLFTAILSNAMQSKGIK